MLAYSELKVTLPDFYEMTYMERQSALKMLKNQLDYEASKTKTKK